MCFRNEVFLNCEHLEPGRKNIFVILVSPETVQKSLPTFWSKLFTIYFVPCLSLGDEVVVFVHVVCNELVEVLLVESPGLSESSDGSSRRIDAAYQNGSQKRSISFSKHDSSLVRPEIGEIRSDESI